MSEKLKVKSVYELTPMQEGIFYNYLYDPKSSAYFEQMIIKIQGDLDIGVLEQSFQGVVQKYDILRTNFLNKKAKIPVQVVMEKRELNIQYIDTDILQPEKRDGFLSDFLEEDKNNGFDLEKGMLFRVALIRTGKFLYNLVISYHHIIMDGWSKSIILQEVFERYRALRNHLNYSEGNVRQFGEYIKWLQTQKKEEAVDYWKSYLKDISGTSFLPKTEKLDSSIYVQKEYKYVLDSKLSEGLIALSKEYKLSVSSILQSIWAVLLHKYSNEKDAVFGVVMSGRNPQIKDIENMAGIFINTVPLRVSIKECGESLID
ncbi:MAG: non-ribosomal peptide synthetase, partial [Clostridiaceae bacterium]|nr:non-ribosomal peptide synthetase [Clostridiaceae bacterium]